MTDTQGKPSEATVKDSLTAQAPEGFALVPIEITPEMQSAAAFAANGAKDRSFGGLIRAAYSAMIAARPQRKESGND